MKVLVAGAGPAGLYFSYLLKRHDPRCEIRVVDLQMADVPQDMESIGEVVIRGDLIMDGYYKEPKATADVLSRLGVGLTLRRDDRAGLDRLVCHAAGRLRAYVARRRRLVA